VDHLLFTHHHFDHDVDYPCFLLARWSESVGTENPLQVIGPKLTKLISHRLVDENEGAFAHDWVARINHPLSLHWYTGRMGKLPRPPLSVNARDVGLGLVHSGNSWQITAAPAEHVEPWLDSLAYRLNSNEGSVVVTGDTRPCDSVEKAGLWCRRHGLYVCVRTGGRRRHP
jgi:ribonuclease Z